MDLLQLKYFKVVAEQEHITKSAKLLMVSQPYLSAIVARLEEEMGGQLFDRDGRNVVLNEYGKILLHHANEALQHLEDAKKEIADMRSRDTKYIRLGSSSTMLSKRWLVDFLKEHDDIRLAHLLAAHNEIMDGLLSGRFDFGLTTGRLKSFQCPCGKTVIHRWSEPGTLWPAAGRSICRISKTKRSAPCRRIKASCGSLTSCVKKPASSRTLYWKAMLSC